MSVILEKEERKRNWKRIFHDLHILVAKYGGRHETEGLGGVIHCSIGFYCLRSDVFAQLFQVGEQ